VKCFSLKVMFKSLGEGFSGGVAAIDVLHLFSKTSTTENNSLFGSRDSSGNVSIRKSLTNDDIRVDSSFRCFETLIGPLLGVVGVVLAVGNVVVVSHTGDVITKGGPCTGAQRKARVASVLIDDGIPDGVQVRGTAL